MHAINTTHQLEAVAAKAQARVKAMESEDVEANRGSVGVPWGVASAALPTMDWRVQRRVEADFVNAIRGGRSIDRTDFATGVRYMEFTEAVARSATDGQAVHLPLERI